MRLRRILTVLILSLPALVLGGASAFAGQASGPVPPPVPAFPAAKGAPPPTSAAYWGDRRVSQTFMNDSGFGCSPGTAVLGWGLTRTANESVYYNAQGSNTYTIHFQSCGNSVCVWVGSNQNGAGLYLAPCNGTPGTRDTWVPESTPLGIEYANDSSGWLFTCWNAGNQCSQNNYDGGGGSVWNAYS